MFERTRNQNSRIAKSYTGFCLLILRQMQLMFVHSHERSELPAIFGRTVKFSAVKGLEANYFRQLYNNSYTIMTAPEHGRNSQNDSP